MRDNIVQHLQGETLGAYNVSTELPWLENGEPLYSLNPKVIYIDEDQTDQEIVLQVLNGNDVMKTITQVRVYVSNDAKTLPADYNTMKQVLSDTKDTSLISNSYDKEVDITTSYEGDMLVTQALYRFTTIN